jgi:hypothetical protein
LIETTKKKVLRAVPELNVGGGGLGGTYFSPPPPTKKNCERPPSPIKKFVTHKISISKIAILESRFWFIVYVPLLSITSVKAFIVYFYCITESR